MQQYVERKVIKTFLGDGQVDPYRRGQMIRVDPQMARDYDNQGFTEAPKAAPSKAAAAASAADNKAKAAKASETKESATKDASGLEPWTHSIPPADYVARYTGKDNSDSVNETLKLARAHVRAENAKG